MESNEQFSFPNYLSKSQEDSGIDFKVWFFRVLGIWPWLLVSVFVSLFCVFLIHRYATPTYLVSASMLVQSDDSANGRELLEEMSLFSQQVNVENEIAVLKSWSFINEVIDSLDFEVVYSQSGRIKSTEIYRAEVPFRVKVVQNTGVLNGHGVKIELLEDGNFSIAPTEDKGIPGIIEGKMTFPGMVTGEGYALEISKTEDFNINEITSKYFEVRVFDPNELAMSYRTALNVSSGRTATALLSLDYESHSIPKAKDFINKVMEFYIKKELDEKNLTAERTIEFINGQLVDIQDSLNTIEDRLQNFRTTNNIVDLSQKGEAVLGEIQELESAKSSAEVKLNYFDYLLSYLNENRNPASVVSPATVGVESPILLALINNLNELSAQLSQVELNATEVNPQVQSLRIQIQRVMEGVIDNVENLKESTKLSLSNIERRMSEAENKISELPSTERAYVGIQRNFSLNENLFVYLQEKRAEAGIAKASNVPETKIIDPALVVKKTYPNAKKNYLLAFLIGFGLPIAFLVGRSYFDRTIHSVQDIEQNTDLPVLGLLAFSHEKTEFVFHKHPKSLAAETFRKLRASMKYLEKKNPLQTIMVTSFLSGDGKTFTSINMATMMADMGKKTILLGMDLRKQKLHSIYDVPNDNGMSNVLNGEVRWTEVLHQTVSKNLDLITGGPVPPNPNELISGEIFEMVIGELRKQYDYIIIDTPPVGLVSDGIEMGKMADVTLFITRHDYTPRHALDYINDVSRKQLISNIGLVLNGVDFKKIKNRHSHSYGYGYGYGIQNSKGYYET